MIGFPPEETGERFRNVELDSGDYLAAGETNTMLLGHKIADKYDLQAGDVANFRGVDFKVKGVFKPYGGILHQRKRRGTTGNSADHRASEA